MTGKNEIQEFNSGRTNSPYLAPDPHQRSLAMITGVLCFILSVFFYYGTVLRVHFERTNLLDLGPYPDAVEYFAQANSISREGAPTIQIGHDKLPSRYPPGYPILMIPWLTFLPHNGILAPFRTNQTIGALLLTGTFVFYFAIRRPLAGGLAALLLAAQPGFTSFSRSSMSDLSGAAAAVLAIVLVYVGLRRERRWPIYCAAIVLGLSLSIRPQLVFFAPLLVAMALFPANVSWTRWFMHCCLALEVFAVAASPYFILNTLQFGHPLKTGYDFWIPWWSESGRFFSLLNVHPQLVMIWSEITANWHEFRVANLFGTGTYIVPAFMLLCAIGVAFLRLNRFTLSAFLAGISYLAATLTYAFVDGRFYLPVLFLLVGLAVVPAEWAVSQAIKMRFSIWAVAILTVFALTCIGYPSQSGFEPKSGRSQAWDALGYAKDKTRSRWFEAQKEFSRVFGAAPGIVLSDMDPPYLNALLAKPFVAAPIDEKHNYRYSRQWRYGKAETIQLVDSALEQGRPVYGLFVPSKELDQNLQRLPLVNGYSWKRSERSDTAAVIMTLTKDASLTTLDSGSR